jgi:hypothetical protein
MDAEGMPAPTIISFSLIPISIAAPAASHRSPISSPNRMQGNFAIAKSSTPVLKANLSEGKIYNWE